jgi:hypothetical protein
MIHTVTQGSTRERSQLSSKECAAEAAATAIATENGPGNRTERPTLDRSALGVRTHADAAGEQSGKGQSRNDERLIFHDDTKLRIRMRWPLSAGVASTESDVQNNYYGGIGGSFLLEANCTIIFDHKRRS